MQSIESNEVLEEIRLLFNLQKEVIFFTLILLAQPSFKENLEKFPHFKQRIPIRYELSPLGDLALLAGYLDSLEVIREDTILQVAQDLGETPND